MKTYKSVKGSGVYSILGITAAYDILLAIILYMVSYYEISTLIKMTMIVFNIYQFYYMIISCSLTYSIDNQNIYINSALGLKNIVIPFSEIQGYQKAQGYIRGVKLSGYGNSKFAIGRSIIDKIGSTYMFVTSTKNIIYLRTEDINYGLSPENFDKFEEKLNEKCINQLIWDYKINKNVNLYKDKKFFVPFVIVAIIVTIITVTPIILYLYNKLPSMMPLNFNPEFVAIKFGTAKQFAFKHMFYGILNMAILFCMYYAAYFCAKYDRKSAYKFIYIPLILSMMFFIMQVRILLTFR
ncbi:PH domain-containing protein [Clostridium sp. OS1-26]|uniref:PH domain-containing protein n=1 Tax=Clostridium sp. OS1-26 TaxID=3070681 RepID=UPI0027E1BB19|nr:PH domain-containing protein [Clostridium sp. OS1-26]WML35603.1 PH domain-containing protein [Clostridium sp. OS1-26]